MPSIAKMTVSTRAGVLHGLLTSTSGAVQFVYTFLSFLLLLFSYSRKSSLIRQDRSVPVGERQSLMMALNSRASSSR